MLGQFRREAVARGERDEHRPTWGSKTRQGLATRIACSAKSCISPDDIVHRSHDEAPLRKIVSGVDPAAALAPGRDDHRVALLPCPQCRDADAQHPGDGTNGMDRTLTRASLQVGGLSEDASLTNPSPRSW